MNSDALVEQVPFELKKYHPGRGAVLVRYVERIDSGDVKVNVLALGSSGLYLSNTDGTVVKVSAYDDIFEILCFQKHLQLRFKSDDERLLLCLSPFESNTSNSPEVVYRAFSTKCKRAKIERLQSADQLNLSNRHRLEGFLADNHNVGDEELSKCDWKHVFKLLYSKYNSAKLGEVDSLVDVFHGKELSLLAGISKKYLIPLDEVAQAVLVAMQLKSSDEEPEVCGCVKIEEVPAEQTLNAMVEVQETFNATITTDDAVNDIESSSKETASIDEGEVNKSEATNLDKEVHVGEYHTDMATMLTQMTAAHDSWSLPRTDCDTPPIEWNAGNVELEYNWQPEFIEAQIAAAAVERVLEDDDNDFTSDKLTEFTPKTLRISSLENRFSKGVLPNFEVFDTVPESTQFEKESLIVPTVAVSPKRLYGAQREIPSSAIVHEPIWSVADNDEDAQVTVDTKFAECDTEISGGISLLASQTIISAPTMKETKEASTMTSSIDSLYSKKPPVARPRDRHDSRCHDDEMPAQRALSTSLSRYFIAANATEQHSILSPKTEPILHVSDAITWEHLLRVGGTEVLRSYREQTPSNVFEFASTVYFKWSDRVQCSFFETLSLLMADSELLVSFLRAMAFAVNGKFESITLSFGETEVSCPRVLFESLVFVFSKRRHLLLTVSSRFGVIRIENVNVSFLEFFDSAFCCLLSATQHCYSDEARFVTPMVPFGMSFAAIDRHLRRERMRLDVAGTHFASPTPDQFHKLWADGNVLLRVSSTFDVDTSEERFAATSSIPLSDWNDIVAKWNSSRSRL